MTYREFINLDRTDEPGLNNEQFRALLTVARMWFETQETKRRQEGHRGRPVASVEPEEAPDFDLAEELW